MSGKSVSEFGKKISEEDMNQTVALREALEWHDALMDLEFAGRKDKESAARFRLSKKIGVPESYLFRLAHKRRDMRDVAGEVYRRLCVAIEGKADALEARRLGRTGNAVVQSAGEAGEGTGAGRH